MTDRGPSEDVGFRVLVVDDEESARTVHARALLKKGFFVEAVASGAEALQALQVRPFTVVISDIDMPEMNGIQLLERIRAIDAEIPVIFLTGLPSMDTAIQAVGLGALKYLMKPVALAELASVVTDACQIRTLAAARRRALEDAGAVVQMANHESLDLTFARALRTLDVVYQPIVSWSRKAVHAYEALVRPREPALPSPTALIDAAERLGRVADLGRAIRHVATTTMRAADPGALLFLNLHPTDLFDDLLTTNVQFPLDRIVLEVTERSSLDEMAGIQERVAWLRAAGLRIALDDFGAGYGGLTSFSHLHPDVVKLDMGLIRRIETDHTTQTLVSTIVAMCGGLGVSVIAEGVETAEEFRVLADLGCDLFQGYLFARPGPAFPVPRFDVGVG